MSWSSRQTQSDAVPNPPGLHELKWRSGDYASFVKRMRHLVHTLSLPMPTGRPEQPLAQLDTRLEDSRSGGADFGLALMEAWAVACDVLAFYGERIANEAFIGTAIEDRSIRELVNMIGYKPHPGLAAETWLTFFLAESKGAPTMALIPEGTKVESVPGQDEDAQIFETSETLEGRTTLNRFQPHHILRTVSYPLRSDSSLIRLAPSPTRPTAGDPILIVSQQKSAKVVKSAYHVRRITGIDANKDQLLLELATEADKTTKRQILKEPLITTFGKSSALFGYQAPLWEDLSEDVRRRVFPPEGGVYVGDSQGSKWRRTSDLPEGDIRAMVATSEGIFIALSGGSLLRTQDEGRNWRQMRLAAPEVLSLATDDQGHLYAGTPDGLIFRSKNGGDSWTAVRGLVNFSGRGAFAEAEDTTMPEVAVTALFSAHGEVSIGWLKRLENTLDISQLVGLLNPGNYVSMARLLAENSGKLAKAAYQLLKDILLYFKGLVKTRVQEIEEARGMGETSAEPPMGRLVFAGTEAGVFRSIPGGWEAANQGLPGYDEKTGQATVVVNAFARAAQYIVIATDQGLFRTDNFGNTWKACTKGLPYRDRETGIAQVKIYCLVAIEREDESIMLLAGTPYGMYCSNDAGTNWETANQDLPMRRAEKGPNLLTVRHLANGSKDDPERVFAATDNGLFTSSAAGDSWEPLNQNLRASKFKVLDEGISEQLDRGILPPKLRVSFEKAGCGLTLFAYPKVEESGNAWTVPDEPRAGVYHLRKEGRWLKVTSRMTDIRAMAIGPSGALVVGTPANDYTEDEWPNLWIEGNHVDLATREREIAPGSTLLLVQDDLADYYTIREVTTVNRKDFTLRGTVTRLTVDHTRNLTRFDIRKAQAWFISRNRSLARVVQPDLTPVTGISLEIEGGEHNIPAGRKLLVTGKCARARIGRVGGLFSIEDYGGELLGLSLRDPQVLATDSQLRILVGTANGVWRYDGESFVSLGLSEYLIDKMVVEHSLDEIYVHVPEGCEGVHLFRYRQGRWQPLNSPGTITAMALRHTHLDDKRNRKGSLYLASEGLLWYSYDHGDRFQLLGVGLEGVYVTSLAVDEQRGYLYAGTRRQGVYYLAPGKDRWEPFNNGLQNWRITCMYVSLENGDIFAGTHEGLFQAKSPGDTWVSMRSHLRVRHITAVLHHEGQLIVGTRGGAVFTLHDGEQDWYDHPWGISNHITDVCAGINNVLVVAARSHALLTAPGARETIMRHEPLFQLKPVPQLAPENFRDHLSPSFRKLGVELSDKAQLFVSTHEEDAWMVVDESRRYLLYRGEESLMVMRPCPPAKLTQITRQVDTRTQIWSLDAGSGLPAEIPARENELIYEVAPEDDPLIGEAVVITEVENFIEAGYTRLSFTHSLLQAFDRASVEVLGNVVRASHGQSFQEVLGSGDGAKANQRFRLRGRDLTFTNDDEGPQSTLSLKVNPNEQGVGVKWSERDSLFPNDPANRGFVTRRDGLNRVSLIFGDGSNGARLPTGKDNIVATYRIGIGEKGNITASSLTQMLAAPLGVRKVNNPLPADGGLNPERPIESRYKAPIQVRTIGRILSLRDLADYLRLYPNVEHVAVKPIWNGYNILGHVTLALRDNMPLTKHSAFFKNMLNTINFIKARTFGDVLVDGYLPLWFNVSAQIWIDKSKDPRRVEERARQALLHEFGFANVSFGRQINVPDVTLVLRDVDGVAAVEVTQLFPEGTMPSLLESLETPEAYWDTSRNQVVQARLLMVHPRGINLSMETLETSP